MADIDTKLLNVYCANYTRTLYYNVGDSTLPTLVPTMSASEEMFKQLVNSNTYTCFARGNKSCSFEEYLKSGLIAKYNSSERLSIQKLTNCYKPSSDTVTLLDCKELAPYHYGLPVFDIKMKRVKYTEGLVHLLNYSTVLPPSFNIENITLFIPDGDEQVENMVSVSIEGEKDYYYENNAITKVNCQHAKQDKTLRVFKDEHIINLKHFKGWILDIVVTYNHPGTTRHPRKLSTIKRQAHIISDHEANRFFDIMFGTRLDDFEAECQKIREYEKSVDQALLERTTETKIEDEKQVLNALQQRVRDSMGGGDMFLHDAIRELITKLTHSNNYMNFKSRLDFIVTAARGLSQAWKLLIIKQLQEQGLASDSRGDNLYRQQERIAATSISKGAALNIASTAKLKAKAGKARAAAKARVEVGRELAAGRDELGDISDDNSGGARKKRKRNTKKRKRKNKKLKKTYKKRRSTKNIRRIK